MSNRFPYDQNDSTYLPLAMVAMVDGREVLHGAYRPVLTGRRATQSFERRAKNFSTNPEKYAETVMPVHARQQRREADRVQQRQAKRGRKLYVRRELAKERAASDLANLFNIIDGRVPGNVARAQRAIDARVDYLAIERVRANPDEDFTDAEIVQQLRTIAATATLPAPKVKAVA
jgi:hypothetical protein